MPQQNRFAEAVIAALGTAANLVKSVTYPVGEGELAFSTDTHRLYVAQSTSGGNFVRVHGSDMIMTYAGEVMTCAGEVLWKGEYS